MASNMSRSTNCAAEVLGQRDHADRQRRPGGDAALHLQALRRSSAASSACGATRSSQISSEEPPPMSNTSAKSQAEIDQRGAAGDGQLGLRLAADDLDVEPGLRARALQELAARWRRARQASVAIRPERTTRCRSILAAHTFSASMVRSIAASESRPLADTPSPRRMMREKASMTLKPRRDGRRHQQPAIVGAEIERGIGGFGRLAGRRHLEPAIAVGRQRSTRHYSRTRRGRARRLASPTLAVCGAQLGCVLPILTALHLRLPRSVSAPPCRRASFCLRLEATLAVRRPG